jgi:hypothetical protein
VWVAKLATPSSGVCCVTRARQCPRVPPNREPVSTHANESEKYLNALADRAFLKLWCYPNLFINKGGPKELCDLLLIFGDDVAIFSDKHCDFGDGTQPERVRWRRWHEGAVLASARQVAGAERMLRAHRDVFVDRKCTQALPLRIPTNAKIHRVLTVGGAAEAAAAAFHGRGSLLTTSRPLPACAEAPFRLGCTDERGRFFHVFDRNGLDAVLGTLDTAYDFLDYLSKRERLLTRGCDLVASSEEDLLAFFMLSFDETTKTRDFPRGLGSAHFVDRSSWTRWQASEQRVARDAANQTSYFWDHLVEKFTYYFMRGEAEHTSCDDVNEFEQLARWLGRASRLRRRVLAQSLLDMMRTTAPGQIRRRLIVALEPGEPFWVFVVAPQPPFGSYEDYREVRRLLLRDHMCVVKHLHPEVLDIVGIAIGETDGELTEDAMLMDCREWSAELEELGRRLHVEEGIFKQPARLAGTVYEYPV